MELAERVLGVARHGREKRLVGHAVVYLRSVRPPPVLRLIAVNWVIRPVENQMGAEFKDQVFKIHRRWERWNSRLSANLPPAASPW